MSKSLNKVLAITAIILLACIVLAAAFYIYYKSTHYKFSIDTDSVGKIVYCTNTNTARQNSSKIIITNKDGIRDILEIYSGMAFKKYHSKQGYPDGWTPNIAVYDSNNHVMLEFSSWGRFLYKGKELYINPNYSESNAEELNNKVIAILNRGKQV